MEISDKYGRTYHYPFSPGVKNDDRINHEWQNVCGHDSVFTEKLDGENTCISQFAIHSIEYKNLDSHFYVFGIRDGGKKWLSWEDVKFWCGVLDLPVVPVLFEGKIETPEEHKKIVLSIANTRGSFDPYDTITGKPTTIEGLVSRPSAEFLVEDFSTLVSKYVRKDHVSTDEHWTRNWKRAKLNFENASR